MIYPCKVCRPHDYQDGRYGNDMRVHNQAQKGFRCTVCGNEVPIQDIDNRYLKQQPRPEVED